MSDYKVGDKFVVEIEEKKECGKVEVFKGKGLTYVGEALDRLDRLDSDYINENFGKLQDEAYESGRKAGLEAAIKWSMQNEADGYDAGLNDAWELAKKIVLGENDGGVSYTELFTVYGTSDMESILNQSPQEALAKMEAYEKGQAEIKVGDVVVVNNDIKGVVLDEGGNEDELIVFTEKACVEPCLKGYLRKTGEHLNEVQSILQQLGGGSE